MDYRGIFEDAVDALRQEKRYRVFADLERIAGRFPTAVYRDASDNAREITIWCSNDYLGMGQHPVTIAAMPPFTSHAPRPYSRPSRISPPNGSTVIPSTGTVS